MTDVEARGQHQRHNPALRVLEGAFIVGVSVYVVGPLAHEVFAMEGRSNTILTTAVTVIMAWFWSKVDRRIHSAVKLDFLSPYFGHRLNYAIQVLKAK